MGCKNSIKNIAENLSNLFKSSRSKLPMIPPILLMAGAQFRPGLDPKLIASKIIKRQSEAGLPTGPAPDGTGNAMEAMYAIMVDEIINAIVLESKVDVVIPPGTIQVVASGANAGGPVVCTGANITPSSGLGTVR